MSGPPSDATIWTRERRYFFTSRSQSTKTTVMRSSPPLPGDLTHLVRSRGALVPDRRARERQKRGFQRIGTGLLLELRRRAGGDNAPMVDHRDAIRHAIRLVHIVGGEEHRHALAAPEAAHVGPHLIGLCGSRPSVGSSRNNTFGVCSSPRAISRRRFMPPENVFTRSSRRSHSSNIRNRISHRSRRARRATWYSTPWISMFSHAVSSLSRLGSWNTTPNRLRTSVRCVVTSRPSSSSEPDVGCNRVVSILMVVVLPAPFGPRNAKISPGRTSKETSLTAMMVPNDLTMCWTRMIGRSPTYALGAAGLAA